MDVTVVLKVQHKPHWWLPFLTRNINIGDMAGIKMKKQGHGPIYKSLQSLGGYIEKTYILKIQ